MAQTRAPRTHNFDRSIWGHAQHLRKIDEDGSGVSTWSGLVISTPLVREGDFIEWATDYGRLRLLVEKTEWIRDPDDMVKVTLARSVERFGKDGESLWKIDDAGVSR